MHHTLAYIDWLMPSWSLWSRGEDTQLKQMAHKQCVIVKEMGAPCGETREHEEGTTWVR